MSLSITPEMDRESIRRMGHSLIAYSRLRSLAKMSRQQLADMPKEVMIACAPNEIALVWDKLPEHLQNDIDVLKYQYCTEHFDNNNKSNADLNDGPPSKKIFCCYCKVNDVKIMSDNEADISLSSTPKKRKLNPLHCCSRQ